jgi:uncharacterized coiled-coil protein SlyX
MNEAEHQRIIDELQSVIDETRATMARFEAAGMDEQMPEDYQKLHDIYAQAVDDQRHHTLAMLDMP